MEVILLRKTTDPKLFFIKGLFTTSLSGGDRGDSQDAPHFANPHRLLNNSSVPPPAANVAAAAIGTTLRPMMLGMVDAM
ncbi:hypothetical protein ACHAXM_009066 [Skeletonema potamos]